MATLDIYDEFLNYGDRLLEKPYVLLDTKDGDSFQKETKSSLKKIHDLLGDFHNSLIEKHTFNKIIIDRMDQDQIWAQINRTSEIVQREFKKGLKILKAKDKPKKEEKMELEEEEESKPKSEDSEKNDNEQADEENELNEKESLAGSQENNNKSDEGKIDYDDLENFLEEAEKQDFKEIQDELYGEASEGEEGEENIDEDEEELDEGEGEDIKYDEFYKGDGDMEEEGEENHDDELENGVFEEIRDAEMEENNKENKEKTKLDEEIDKLEDKMLNAKTWQLKGEVRSTQRPKNSLLEEKLDFKSGAQILENTISREFSENLEKVIKQRVLDEAWDDVAEYAFAKPMQENFSTKEALDFEKSQKGLAEIYEDKFKKNILNLPVETEGDKAKVEIHELFKNICFHLDNLSNLSFVPKPEALAPAKISMNNVPSIRREEKIPVFVSEGMQKSANELFDNRKKAVFEEKVEMAKEDKRKMHRKVKRNIRNRIKEKQRKEKINELSVKGQTKFEYNQLKKSQAKIKKETEQKNTQSIKFSKSSQFFQNLQAVNDKNAKGEKEKTGKKKENNVDNRRNFKL